MLNYATDKLWIPAEQNADIINIISQRLLLVCAVNVDWSTLKYNQMNESLPFQLTNPSPSQKLWYNLDWKSIRISSGAETQTAE